MTIRPAQWLMLLALVGVSALTRRAETCGMFVAAPSVTVPSLAVEQTLIVFDADKQLEHFIRQVVIRDPSPGFGFVVPVPEQPEVKAVKASPFERLAHDYPPNGNRLVMTVARRATHSKAAVAPGGPAVSVLSRETVGSFTAFVLAATDAGALEKWLTDNHFATPPEARAWLGHYVELGFYFAALRYEVHSAVVHKDVTRAEALRISFRTPLPFYPYREPEHAAPVSAPEPRELAVWLIAPGGGYSPVSLVQDGTSAVWERPLVEHGSSAVTRSGLATTLGSAVAALLPAPDLRIQTFEDQKRSRPGFGDIVMIPNGESALREDTIERSARLLTPATAPAEPRPHALSLRNLLESRLSATELPAVFTDSAVSYDHWLFDKLGIQPARGQAAAPPPAGQSL